MKAKTGASVRLAVVWDVEHRLLFPTSIKRFAKTFVFKVSCSMVGRVRKTELGYVERDRKSQNVLHGTRMTMEPTSEMQVLGRV